MVVRALLAGASLMLGTAAPAADESASARAPAGGEQRIGESRYLYRPAPAEEGSGRDEVAAISFDTGRLTDGDVARGIHWDGGKDAPLKLRVVFDLLRDVPLQRIVLHTRRPNRFFRTDSVSVDGRGETDRHYRILLSGREGLRDPWEALEIPLDGRPVRYVRIELSRRHSFVLTPLTEVEFFAEAAPASSGSGRAEGDLAAEFEIEPLLVDRYGQYLYEDWPGKIRQEKDFQRDRAAETERLGEAVRDSARFDRFGGRRDAGTHPATGFFRLQNTDGRWWFVTPEGHLFFLNGVDVTHPGEGGYSTALEKEPGRPRGVFAELPDRSRFPQAYTTIDGVPKVNFLLANLHRKYGSEAAWAEVMRRRLIDWGFNAHAKWTRYGSIELPYITVLRPAGARRIRWACDPFDPEFPKHVEKGIRGVLAEMRDDPWIIGHTFENEKGWDLEVAAAMLQLGTDSPAKAAFVDFLHEKYAGRLPDLRRVLGKEDVSRDGLLRKPLALSDALREDAKAFVFEASRRYYRVVREAIRRHDPHHLFLGSSLTPGWRNSYEWAAGSAGFVDALSFDYYQPDRRWIEPYLSLDVPILLLEYSFVVAGRGLAGFHHVVPTQRDRGLVYREVMESLAALPQFVGAGWFALYDQPVTGRDRSGGGENHNFGLINQADQPYEEMLDEMRKTSHRLFEIHEGKIPPLSPPPPHS